MNLPVSHHWVIEALDAAKSITINRMNCTFPSLLQLRSRCSAGITLLPASRGPSSSQAGTSHLWLLHNKKPWHRRVHSPWTPLFSFLRCTAWLFKWCSFSLHWISFLVVPVVCFPSIRDWNRALLKHPAQWKTWKYYFPKKKKISLFYPQEL